MLLPLLCAGLSVALSFLTEVSAAGQPNIVLIVADDLGFNDVSWHNPDIVSPNLARLAADGIVLENSYVMPICTPTRSALMTGYYPIHTGRQYSVFWLQEPRGLFTNFTLLPQHLNELGYSSHMVGKWHLGYCNKEYIPTRRGFRSFNGFYEGSQDYYRHTMAASVGGGPPGYDFRKDEDVDLSANGTYSSLLYAEHATRLIREHAAKNESSPLFLYLAFQDTHAPLQVPKRFEDLYPNTKSKARRTFSGMVSALDEAVGNVTKALTDAGMLNDTIIIFTADNGGQVLEGGNNYPLRGNKGTLWEGGTRASAFVHAPFLNRGGQVHQGLIHVTDWLPTLVSAGGGDSASLGSIDGVDQWKSLVTGAETPRTEMLYNIDPLPDIGMNPGAAIRIGEMKLIRGDAGRPDGWIKPDVTVEVDEDHLRNLLAIFGNSFQQLSDLNEPQVQLFNLTADPTEHVDLADQHMDLVEAMLKRLEEYEATMIPPDVAPDVAEGNPNNFGGFLTPGWCEARPGLAEKMSKNVVLDIVP